MPKTAKTAVSCTNSGSSTGIIGILFFSIPVRTMIWRVMRPDFDLARTANGWCECRNWERVIRRSFSIQERVSILACDHQTPWRSGLGLFLHDAGIKGDASGPEGSVCAGSRLRGTGQGHGGKLRLD